MPREKREGRLWMIVNINSVKNKWSYPIGWGVKYNKLPGAPIYQCDWFLAHSLCRIRYGVPCDIISANMYPQPSRISDAEMEELTRDPREQIDFD
jgi:hypothetical protein